MFEAEAPTTDRRRHAVFRCDASALMGGGHLRRCLTLAEALAARGWRLSFAVRKDTLAHLSEAHPRGSRHCAERWLVVDGAARTEAADMAVALVSAAPPGSIRAGGLADLPADLLVVDHYGRDYRFEAACRAFARRILVIDDLADRYHDADILLDQTFARSGGDYGGLVAPACQLLCGSRYALLRPEFAALRATALARRRRDNALKRVVVSMGATDAGNATGAVLDALNVCRARGGPELAADIVLASSAPHLEAIRRRVETSSLSVRLHVDASAEAMAALMSAADVAIGAAGTTSWERCCLGLPSLVVITADNQILIARHLADAGACRIVGGAGRLTPRDIADELEALLGNRGALRAMAESAAAVCDGAGVARVADRIEHLLAEPAGNGAAANGAAANGALVA